MTTQLATWLDLFGIHSQIFICLIKSSLVIKLQYSGPPMNRLRRKNKVSSSALFHASRPYHLFNSVVCRFNMAARCVEQTVTTRDMIEPKFEVECAGAGGWSSSQENLTYSWLSQLRSRHMFWRRRMRSTRTALAWRLSYSRAISFDQQGSQRASAPSLASCSSSWFMSTDVMSSPGLITKLWFTEVIKARSFRQSIIMSTVFLKYTFMDL